MVPEKKAKRAINVAMFGFYYFIYLCFFMVVRANWIFLISGKCLFDEIMGIIIRQDMEFVMRTEKL